MIKQINQVFEQHFGKASICVKSPGRVNLIGEHTDYNDGFVLPAAIDLATYFICNQNDVNKFRLYSYNLEEYYETPVDKLAISNKKWANFLLGVIVQFVKAGKEVRGFDCVFGGDLPMGIGMSSSAALETGLAFAINQMGEFGYKNFDLVSFSQKAEHEYAGVQCGIMDQFAVMNGRTNQVIKLDCRSLDYSYHPFEMQDQMLVLVDSGVKRSLDGSEYNVRRQECDAGVSVLQKYNPEIRALRDVTIEMIQIHKKELDTLVYNRCLYVLEENIRVEKACEALDHNDFISFGKQMFDSHEGLKNLYEVSCPELDQLVELAKGVGGVLGSRMMGGGFGGCTINLIKKHAIGCFEENIIEHYKTSGGDSPHIIKINIDEGTHLVSI